MAYEELGNVETVTLGGVDAKTKRRNPTELEGYLVGIEQRPNKFNPSKPQNYYIFQTPEGLRGVYGKAGIDNVMKGAIHGAMIKLVATGELRDTGKGNPMKVFKAYQDKSNRIDVSNVVFTTETSVEPDQEYAYEGAEETGLTEEEVLPDEVVPARATAPQQAVQAPSAAKVAAVQAMLKGRTGARTA